MKIQNRIVLATALTTALGLGFGLDSRAVGADEWHSTGATQLIQTQAVARLIEERFPGAVVDNVESDVELGMLVYDVDLFHEGRELSLEIGADGTLLTKQFAARLAGLPASVQEQVPPQLRERRVEVNQIEVYHGLAGDGPRTVYHLEQDGQVWLLDTRGAASTTKSIAPVPAAPKPAQAVQPATEQQTAASAVADGITPINAVRRGQSVVVRGEVQRLRDTDEFILTDATGSIEVYIGWQNPMPVKPGQTVTVRGIADDDVVWGFRPDLYAHRIVLPDGATIDLHRERDD